MFCVSVSGLLGKPDAIVGANSVDKEFSGCLSLGFFHELGDGKLTCSVHTNKEIELALLRLNFGDIDMKEVDGVSLKLLPLWLITLNVG